MHGAISWCRYRTCLVWRSWPRSCWRNAGSGASGRCGGAPRNDRLAVRAGPGEVAAAAGDAVGSLPERTTRVSSQALVRYETNDYSVPVEYGHRQALVKAFVWEVVICCASEVIARHQRSYDREEMIFNPLHYLALLEQKTNALDQAAPLQGWQLPEEFLELRRQMEGRLGKRSRREYVQVLRLLETFSIGEVAAGVRQALQLRAMAFDAVKHLVLCAIERRAAEAGSGELSASAGGGSGANAGRRLPGVADGVGSLMDTPRVLLEHYLKQLRLPTILREFPKLSEQCAKQGATFEQFLLRLVEQEMMDRERRATERRIKAAKFPVSKSLETYDFLAIPSLNKKLVVELARCEWIGRRENVLALGNSGTVKTHIGLVLGLAACRQGFRVRFTTAAALVHELIEARDEKRLLR